MDLFGNEKVKPEETDFAPYNEKIKALFKPVFMGNKVDVIDTIQQMMGLEKEIISKRGKNKNRIENDLLSKILMLFVDLSEDYDTKHVLLTPNMAVDTKNPKLQKFHALSLSILQFANYLFEFDMPKDNFSSARKIFAVQLHCALLFEYDLENKYEILSKALVSGRDSLIVGTADELANLLQQSDFELNDEILNTLTNLTKKSKSRSVVVNCLNALIEAGAISEGGALMVIDDWKCNYNNW